MQELIAWDKALFLALNKLNHPLLDGVFWYISSTGIWIPFYAVLLYFLLKKLTNNFQQKIWENVIMVVLSVVVLIVLSDQISSGFFKPFFQRLRPSHEADLEGLVHLLSPPSGGEVYKGGMYGFVSSHAANSMALAVFLAMLFRNKLFTISILLWAALVSYSRIYLGVHYPGDILGGWIVGVFSAYIATRHFVIWRWFFTNKQRKKESL
jgi:undecaprenyl-diphosphatase